MKPFFFIVIILSLTGCDLFETRQAEEPERPRADFQPATTPDQLIQNLINSFKEKDVQSYISCLADSSFTEKKFQFIPSGGASSQFPSLADQWNVKSEEQYFNNVRSSVQGELPITLSITSTSPPSQQGDSLIFIGNYLLNIPFIDAALPLMYQGDLKLSMVRDSRSLWVIYLWQDTKSTDAPSWSELKGRFY